MALAWVLPCVLLACATAWYWPVWPGRSRQGFKHRARKFAAEDAAVIGAPRRKPEWVVRIVVGLAVHRLSCRQIAHHFNRRFGRRMTIGKSWVAEVLRAHAGEIESRRRAMRRAAPFPCAVNHAWALDLTFLTNPAGMFYTALGIIDHGSRWVLCLKCLPRKCAFVLLGHLFIAMGQFGLPAVVRTDNEGMFQSTLWKTVLKGLGIRHWRSAVGCPWHNGRIERLFGTLKPLLDKIQPRTKQAMRDVLREFTGFYNHVRVHQNLNGLTPMEAWRGRTLDEVRQLQATQPGQWVSALDGLMVGYRVRCR